MAQDFVGSNNINLLNPSGMFGTRLLGGHDAGSPRYIFTHLKPITKILFNEHDNALLEYLDDDGEQIEPKYFIPLIPIAVIAI
jgi:DNA topoisomerase-2